MNQRFLLMVALFTAGALPLFSQEDERIRPTIYDREAIDMTLYLSLAYDVAVEERPLSCALGIGGQYAGFQGAWEIGFNFLDSIGDMEFFTDFPIGYNIEVIPAALYIPVEFHLFPFGIYTGIKYRELNRVNYPVTLKVGVDLKEQDNKRVPSYIINVCGGTSVDMTQSGGGGPSVVTVYY